MDTQERAVEAKKTDTAVNVDIADSDREIAILMAAINELPDVREARIQKIKQSIESGMYTIDPRKIANKIMRGL